jgi:hypothetical protein
LWGKVGLIDGFHLHWRAGVTKIEPQRRPNPRGVEMTRRSLFSLAFLAAVFAMAGTARAGTPITYDWISPSGGVTVDGVTYHITGSISVDPTGISTTPVDLTSGMVTSWHVSVLDSTNTLLFSLSSPTDVLDLDTTGTSGTDVEVAPQITTTSIYLPSLSLGAAVLTAQSFIDLDSSGNFSFVRFRANRNTSPFYDAATFIAIPNGDSGEAVVSTVNSNDVVATAEVIPEPGSLAIWSLIAGVFSVWGIRKRRRLSADAA